MGTRTKYILITVIAAIAWGSSGTCGEYFFKLYNTDSEWLTTARLLSSGACLFILALARGQKDQLLGILKNRHDFIQLLLFSVCGMMALQYTHHTAIAYTNSGTATVLQYISPAFVLIFTCIVAKRFPQWREAVSLIGISIGVFLIATHGDFHSLIISKPGLFWGIASAIFLTVHNILPIKIIQRWGSLPVTAWAMIFGGIIFGAFTHPFDYSPTIQGDTILVFVIFILIGTVFGFAAFLTGVSHIGPVLASIICCLEPISASILSYFWLGTYFTIYDIIGMVIILIAICVLTLSPQNKSAR